ncbi:hypothetical protein DAPPUDRAFT_244157 [Daphnia pulex]|uniref:Uncharacterized protein n=1 Tax=Daphnia pulex TaxID=6669 RepID=E9GKC0_DAPPU|nr:hypothetical protein DAPPUDRAFT_244157 [Daphnia pulex]|eukprot:EFX80086.1 hypothetical protein DAPPUDRAFT_244157 [Daphnia pulex]
MQSQRIQHRQTSNSQKTYCESSLDNFSNSKDSDEEAVKQGEKEVKEGQGGAREEEKYH